MILLTSTSDKLQVVTTAAVNTDVHATWVDNAAGTITPGRTNTAINTIATTDVVASPAASTQRNVQFLSIRNRGGSAQGVTVKHTDGTTAPELVSVSLAAGEELQYEDGAGWRVLDATGAVKHSITTPGAYLGMTLLTAGTSFTTSAKTSKIRVRMVGGGGGGGGSAGAASSAGFAGGGGAGAYAEKDFAVTPSTVYTYAIGALGAGGTAGNNAGSAGGSTSFTVGGTTVTAPGGSGGSGSGAAAATALTVQGGAGGTVATNGDVNLPGRPGDPGSRSSATIGVSGNGGDSPLGAGGRGQIAHLAGNAAGGYGSGGGGAASVNTAANLAGGAGTAGCIIVEEFA